MDPHFVHHMQPLECSPGNDNNLRIHREGKPMKYRKTLIRQMIPIEPLLAQCISIHPWNPLNSHQSLDAVRIVTLQDCPNELSLLPKIHTWHSASILQSMHKPINYHRDEICNRVQKVEDFSCIYRDHSRLYDVTEMFTRCQCDAYCHIFGDCCYDHTRRVENVLPMSRESQSQEKAVPFMSEVANSLSCMNVELSDTYPRHGMGFYMVGDCPEHKRDSPLQAHCRLDISAENLTYIHYLPIEIHHIVYRNIYCARCFGADISQGEFWAIVFTAYKHYSICKQIMVMMSEMPELPLDLIKKYCGWKGFAGPDVPFNNVKQSMGPTRMGKYCLDKVTWLHSEKGHANNDSDLASWYLTTFDKLDDCRAAFINPPRYQSLDSIVFEKTYQGFRVLASLTDICKYCDAMALLSLTYRIGSIERYITPPSSVSLTDGRLVAFFQGSFNCSFFKDCQNANDEWISADVHVAISQTGSVISIIVLLLLLFLMSRKSFGKTESKRLQISLIVSKIFFFVSFSLSYLLRNIACKLMAILLHFSLILSFSYSITIGVKIALVMWRLKNDLAAMAKENKSDKISKQEVGYQVFIWSFCIVLVGACLGYENLTEEMLFGYDENRFCLTSDEKGWLFLIIIPTAVTLVVNLATIVYSGCSLYFLMASKPLLRTCSVSRLLKFLARMICFQSLQWALGLIFYVSQNETCGLIFEIFGSFEGLMIFCALITSEIA